MNRGEMGANAKGLSPSIPLSVPSLFVTGTAAGGEGEEKQCDRFPGAIA